MTRRASDIIVRQVRHSLQRFDYRTPMKFGGRVVTAASVFNVAVDVETVAGRRATGYGSMTMGTVWAWPSNHLTADQTLSATIKLAERVSMLAEGAKGHPLQISHELAPSRDQLAVELVAALSLPESFPALAVLLAASPLEAAIFDAHGRVNQASSYQLLGREHLPCDLGELVDPSLAGVRLESFIATTPQASMPLYHLVGALDPLSETDVLKRVDDGLPETLGEWIVRDGLNHLKIKLAGDDLEWDVARVIGVDRVANDVAAQRAWHYSLDFNERCQDAQYVLELLDRLADASSSLLTRVQYIEQPTHRDLKRFPENRMHAVAKRIPVVIDEALIDYESLMLAEQQGYSGVALKACKGHAEALVMAAVARHRKMFLCVQDLTCIGASFLHSASLASHIPGVAAIESNGRQYCPRGNDGWDEIYPSMFHVREGAVPTKVLSGWGLGFDWPDVSGSAIR